ncbi:MULTISPECIES: hypothetical protein [Streptosporangium]|uniref:Uncharacterized protein n=1 Tax=Streptosporangium brasiliense TaxID=47480 RepID=A0ABT9RIV4_9ACTN|nr:hypothetical protein [Streptosporangium brasiliense]MDP9869223.1 hypothetical protein [Streptosporangium brasiliense]
MRASPRTRDPLPEQGLVLQSQEQAGAVPDSFARHVVIAAYEAVRRHPSTILTTSCEDLAGSVLRAIAPLMVELPRLDETQPELLPLDPVDAQQFARHVKAALLHLGEAKIILDRAGHTAPLTTVGSRIGDLVRTAYTEVADLERWALNVSATAGNSPRDVYARIDQWCHTASGTLPHGKGHDRCSPVCSCY